MPTGSDLPHFTFTDGGSQSVRTAVDDSENAISSFLSADPKRFLSGANTVIIEESVKGTNSNTRVDNLVEYTTFRLPDDCDAISDVLFHYEFIIASTSATEGSNMRISKTLGLELINKVEVRVGNHIWQTLTGGDIFSRMATENSNGAGREVLDSITTVKADGPIVSDSKGFTVNVAYNGYKYVSGDIDLKLFMGAGRRLNSFIQAGAPNNQIDVRVYFNTITTASLDAHSREFSEDFKASLIVTKHKFTALERDYVRNNIINSVINTSQNKTQNLGNLGVTVPSGDHTEVSFSINVNDFNLNTSHILVIVQQSPYGDNSPTDITEEGLTGAYEWGEYAPRNSSAIRHGVFDCLTHLEFFANGNSVTGKLPANTCIRTLKRAVGLTNLDLFYVYAIPLCSFAFGEDAPSLARLHNKKVVLYTTKFLLGGTNVDTINVNITAVGTNIVTYVGGQCNLQLSN